MNTGEATQQKQPIDLVALGVPRWSQMCWPHNCDAQQWQQLPCKHRAWLAEGSRRSLKAPGQQGPQGGGVPSQITCLAMAVMAQVLVQSRGRQHAAHEQHLPSASWQDPVPSPLWIAPKCSQKLRSSNRVSTFPHHKCAISNGLHTSWAELQMVVQPPMLSGLLGWTSPGPAPALSKVTLMGEEY